MAHSTKLTSHLFTAKDYILIWGVSGVYLGCAALRLATYNVKAINPPKQYDSNYFSGLPSPGAAAAVCSAIIFFDSYGVISQVTYGLPLYAATLGLLMISDIKYIHIGKWLLSVRRNKKRLFVAFVALVAMACSPTDTIIVVVNIYIFSGPVFALLRWSSRTFSPAANTQTPQE